MATLTVTTDIKRGLNLASYLEREFGYINRDDPSDVFAFLVGGIPFRSKAITACPETAPLAP